ncbi:MAG: hypothetical protein ABIU09_13000, partial [Pyrinomonadaceae bacterium]
MNSQDAAWFAVSVRVRSATAEAVEFAFNCLESAGTEISDMPKASRDSVTVIGYFQDLPGEDLLRGELDKALSVYGLPAD